MAKMNKIRISQSFSRAAETYDNVAYFQREVGQHLFSLISLSLNASTIIDVGCGTGFFVKPLVDAFPRARMYGVDIAKGMLDFAKLHNDEAINWVCADAEHLPFRNNSADIIFSNLSMQWCEHTDEFLMEVKRVLKPGGIALLSTLGSTTLNELRRAWELVDNQPHVNRFLDADELKKILDTLNFSSSMLTHETRKLMYSSPVELMRELKDLGAHEVNHRSTSGLMGKKRFRLFLNEYQKIKIGDLFPATYEVIYITLTK
jgi:malonyl-CoA O-methyltransferase